MAEIRVQTAFDGVRFANHVFLRLLFLQKEKRKKKNFDGQQLLKNQASHQPPPTSNYKTHKHELTIQVLMMTITHVMRFDLLVKLYFSLFDN